MKAIFILLANNLVAEASILVRSLMNLHWNFLFLCNARLREDKRWQFEDAPEEGSIESIRAEKYLAWFGVERYRDLMKKGQTDQRIMKFMDEFKKKYGYKSDKEIPRHWYQEKGVSTIKDIANTVGAVKQYDKDYSFLSGIDHSDYTALLMMKIEDVKYEYYLYLKCLSQLAQFLDFVFTIARKESDEKLKNAIPLLESLAIQFLP